jgi:muconate cycloisomerase
MKIVKAEVLLTKVPLRRAHKMAIGTTYHQECVFLRLTLEDGTTGWGEAPHMVRHSGYGETQQTVATSLRDFLIPSVMGKDPTCLEEHQVAMDRALPWNGRAKSAVNLALYDLTGKILETPVFNLLGGKCREAMPLSWSIPIIDVDGALAEVEEMMSRGIRIFKVKAGRADPADDVEIVRRVREAVAEDVSVRVDANQAYDVKTAIRVTNAMQPYDIAFMEQPVRGADIEGLAIVNASVGVPIMADEAAKTPSEVYEVARRRAADIISVYVNPPGGLLNAKKMIAVAEAARLECYLGGALEGPIGARACLHLACSSPSVVFGGEMGGQFLLAEDLGTEEIQFEAGALVVPSAPGLGGELDMAKVRRYLTDQFEVTGR